MLNQVQHDGGLECRPSRASFLHGRRVKRRAKVHAETRRRGDAEDLPRDPRHSALFRLPLYHGPAAVGRGVWGALAQMTGQNMARRGVLGLLAGGVAAVLSGCGLFGGGTYRFRMSVEVETPDGLKTGSSVYEVRAEKDIKLSPDMKSAHTSIRGEAVAVDLPGAKTLFALLKTVAGSGRDGLPYMSMKVLDPAYSNNSVESAQRIASGDGITSPAEVRAEDYPLLVTFADLADPTSVQRVDPANLAASFGQGVTLKRITVEVTNDPVTTGIEKRLGPDFWKNRARIHREQMSKDGGVMENPYFQSLEGRLRRNDFVVGASK